jgi:deoxyribose-phosphate aldolase
MDTAEAARIALACLDLTSLNDGDTRADIDTLCERATGRHGPTAAVCVWPRFAAAARARLPRAVRVAAVANFPDGGSDIERAVRDTQAIVDAGADEVDVVIPYRDLDAAPALLAAVRHAAGSLTLKVIVESGELRHETLIRRACAIALDAGADFLKTSTGKTKTSATPAAARLLLAAIRDGGHVNVGFKPAGGIRTVADAAAYIALTKEHLGAVTPQRFRIGASGLLNDIEAVLGGTAAPPPSSAY